jgi:hypothetical protein
MNQHMWFEVFGTVVLELSWVLLGYLLQPIPEGVFERICSNI